MKNKGITLIALIITIIILLILAGVTINLILGENGLFRTAQKAGEDYEKAGAREKLEAVLVELQADKIAKTEYNQNEYIDNKLKQNNMQVEGDIAIVDGWQFEIDRSVPQIGQSLGKETEFSKETRGKAKFIYNPQTQYVGSAEVSIEIDESIKTNKVQYKIGEGESATWIDYIEGSTFNVTDNTTIYGRIISNETNEIGYSFKIEISNVDKTLPKTAKIEFDKITASVNTVIKATVTQYDDETGIDITNCKYIVNTSKDELGTDSSLWNNATKFSFNPQIIDIKQATAGNYYLHILSIDGGNNLFETVSDVINFKGITYLANVSGYALDSPMKSSWSTSGGAWDNARYPFRGSLQAGAKKRIYVWYKSKVDVTDSDKVSLSAKVFYTASNTIEVSLRLVNSPGGGTPIMEVKQSLYGSGNNKITNNLSIDVSSLERFILCRSKCYL